MTYTKSTVMVLKGLLLGIILTFSCGEKTKTSPYESFKKEINKSAKEIEYKIKNVNNVFIQMPNNINNWAQKYIQNFINKDLENEYCTNKEASIKIIYEVTFATNNFISIKKETKMEFCYPYDNMYIDFINILLFENHIYKIDITDSNYIKQEMKNYLETEDIDLECEYIKGGYKLSLSIEENIAFAYLVKDKVCVLKIPIEIRKDNFEFIR